MNTNSRAAAIMVVIIVAACCGLALAGIKGSKHDFSTDAWEGVDECGACHMPETELQDAVPPLWNNRADLTARFGRDAVRDVDPGMGTLSCLRCHDGTIAKDATGAAIEKDRIVHLRHPAFFEAGHGRTDHPVGVEYPNFDRGYHPANLVTAEWKVVLPNGQVECSSCHDPHSDSGVDHMLRMSNSGSAMCLTCHKK